MIIIWFPSDSPILATSIFQVFPSWEVYNNCYFWIVIRNTSIYSFYIHLQTLPSCNYYFTSQFSDLPYIFNKNWERSWWLSFVSWTRCNDEQMEWKFMENHLYNTAFGGEFLELWYFLIHFYCSLKELKFSIVKFTLRTKVLKLKKYIETILVIHLRVLIWLLLDW